MRTAFTIGTLHGGKKFEIIAASTVPITQQRDLLKSHFAEKTHAQFERVEMWESDSGRVKAKTFTKPEKEKKAS